MTTERRGGARETEEANSGVRLITAENNRYQLSSKYVSSKLNTIHITGSFYKPGDQIHYSFFPAMNDLDSNMTLDLTGSYLIWHLLLLLMVAILQTIDCSCVYIHVD